MCSVKRKKTEEFSWDKEKEEFLINYHRNNSSKLYGSDEFSPTERDERDAKLKLVEVFNEQYGTDLPVGVINERWRLIRGRVTSCIRKMGPLQVREFAMPSELWAYDRCSWLLPHLNRTKDKRDSSEHTVPDGSSREETAVNQIEKDADNLHFCNGSSQVAISDGSKGAQYVPDFVQDGSPSVKSLDKIVETAEEQPALRSDDLDVLETIGGISDQDEEMETRNLNNNPKPLDVNFPKKGKKQDMPESDLASRIRALELAEDDRWQQTVCLRLDWEEVDARMEKRCRMAEERVKVAMNIAKNTIHDVAVLKNRERSRARDMIRLIDRIRTLEGQLTRLRHRVSAPEPPEDSHEGDCSIIQNNVPWEIFENLTLDGEREKPQQDCSGPETQSREKGTKASFSRGRKPE
ncbi:hypothetical protein QAD02_013576 [Eretmocerus hayati]|uniref:Uncharacterized protein n=1 Tax=Eretmocerus hayati TaxID=131215 RepID=A0ACC2P387_9HYME|nr:hypothetical protein QAD02_013576 [Eretmocerus hayati]